LKGRAAAATSAALFVLALAGSGCRSKTTATESAGSAVPKPSARPAPARSATPAASSAPATGCRVLAAKGTAGPGSPAVGKLLTGAEWLDLATGVELSLKHTETTRELRVRGPARLLACPDGAETIVLSQGGVSSIAGPGTRAGATVTLATPFGVVEYADAELTLDVGDKSLTLDVKRGNAWLSASVREERPGAARPKPIAPPAGRVALRGEVDPSSLVTRCKDARDDVTAGAPAPAPSAAAERGKWAISMLEKRKASRLICERARAATGRLAGPERAGLEDLLAGRNSAAPTAEDPSAKASTDAGK
jgi:hypothetical protein